MLPIRCLINLVLPTNLPLFERVGRAITFALLFVNERRGRLTVPLK